MGIRLKMMVLCAILDAKVDNYTIVDERFTANEIPGWHETFPVWDIPYKDIPYNKMSSYQYHQQSAIILYNSIFKDIEIYRGIEHDPEYGLGNIYGIVLPNSCLYDHDVTYALMAIDPKYRQNGYELIPSLGLDDDYSPACHLLKRLINCEIDPKDEIVQKYRHGIASKWFSIRHNWNIGNHVFLCSEDYGEIAYQILRWAGWHGITRKDVKFILYWKWS